MAEMNQDATRKRSRSPGYPNFALPEAIRKAEALYRYDKRNPVALSVAAEHWGYSPTSSAVLLSVATLKKFGLLEEVGGGSMRQLKLTDLSLHLILSPEGSSERAEAIRIAAMRPPIHIELWDQYHDELPSDSNLKRILILEKGFNDSAADDLIREYRETISFANVKSESKMGENGVASLLSETEKMQIATGSVSHPQNSAIGQNLAGLREYRFPLIDAADVQLRLPAPMTAENFDLLKDQLDAFLKVTKRALVAQEHNQDMAGR